MNQARLVSGRLRVFHVLTRESFLIETSPGACIRLFRFFLIFATRKSARIGRKVRQVGVCVRLPPSGSPRRIDFTNRNVRELSVWRISTTLSDRL